MRYFFEPEGFEEYYDYILKGGKSKGYYIDPDACTNVEKTEYYNLLTNFLNCREQENGSTDKFLYIPPKKAKNTCEENMKNEYIDDYKIVVLKNDEVLFRLTTDQFGFSAVESIYVTEANMKKYPLSRMVLLSRDKTDDQKEEIRKQLIKHVINSRTLGGAFVWPIPKEGNRTSEYNKKRGVGSYIEDRVDLTLWEVKCFYQIYEKLSEKTYDAFIEKYDKEYKKNRLFHCGENIKDEYQAMYKFLAHFGTFDNYINFFCFNKNFVRNGKIVDIVNSIVSEGNIKYLEDRENIDTNKKEIQSITEIEVLHHVLENVSSLILKRSEDMEGILNGKQSR